MEMIVSVLIGVGCLTQLIIIICVLVRFFKVTGMMMRHMTREKKFQEVVLSEMEEIKTAVEGVSQSLETSDDQAE